MKKLLLTLAIGVGFSTAFSQNILITDADLDTLNPYDCNNSAPDANFFDSGNNTANYGDNENETITVCPDYTGMNNGLVVSFGVNEGLIFDVDASDTVFVYDGPNTSAPLLGAHNSSNSPNGFNHFSSFDENPTGCLTIQFVSDGSSNSIGWESNISCASLPQPFTPHMTCQLNGTGQDVINPSDTGYIDICYGDSLLFSATGDYPYSSDITGNGYSQNNNNVTYEWTFSDGTLLTGPSVWFNPPFQNGYLVTLKITDSFGQSESIISKVRVSTTPTFTGVMFNRDSLCIGDTTLIVGGVTPSDTAGVHATGGSFELGGSIAGLVYLPDGSGLNYTDTMSIFGFNPGQTLANASDISQLFLDIEHSYLGDLEMTLTCPNGTSITIFDAYPGGMISGGFDGGGTYLGNAYDANIGNPGVGMDYYFSSSNATWGTMATEHGIGNTVAVTNPSGGNAMNPNGIYLPQETFANLAGCPLNGDWVITVRDNLGTDDGYIFEWGLFFDPSINPNTETYLPTITTAQWLSNATILPGNPTDTFIVVSSDLPGVQQYTFEVEDSFGCAYDTIVPIYFLPTPGTQANDTACANQHQITGTTSYNGGVWTYTGPGNATFNANNRWKIHSFL